MTEIQPTKEKNRGDLQRELKEAWQQLEKQPGDTGARFSLAQLLLQAGEFWQAEKIVRPLMDDNPSNEIAAFTANLAYLLGDYAQTEKILLTLIANQRDDAAARTQSEIRLLFTWYQTNQFARSHGLFEGMEASIQLPHWQQMKSFGDEPPYSVNWHDQSAAIAPFILTDPLPLIEVTLQGKRIYTLIDTGGDSLYLDDEYAAELGIEAAAHTVGRFGGGLEGKIGFARGNDLELGGVSLNSVPVTIMPTQRWSKGFADGKYTIGGVIGTGILKQFLATIDYPDSRLVLRPRGAAGKQAWTKQHRGIDFTEIPFVMWHTHHMLAKGSLNEYDGLTWFVDSGLASSAALAAPVQTLEYAGIPAPQTAVPEDGIGGGGEGIWARGSFDVAKLGLGPLIKRHVEGDYGSMTSETYWQKGFIQDGLISHQFLRDYRWTLDFDDMKYYFVKP